MLKRKASISSRKTSTFQLKTKHVTFTGRQRLHDKTHAHYPLVIALHGGTYYSAYFDVPGMSFLDVSASLGINAIALDRPGYGGSTKLPKGEATILNNAERLDDAIGRIWQESNHIASGIVVIGHSIGGAITIAIAARRPSWPLLGIAISGVGLQTPPESGKAWASLPDQEMIELPSDLKDSVMFGPQGTYFPEAPNLSHVADTAVPRTELIDITTTWEENVNALAQHVNVPVHYRQGEFDRLWVTGENEISKFAQAFSSSPDVDARLYPAAGHCIEFHKPGTAFQLEQAAFAIRCGANAT